MLRQAQQDIANTYCYFADVSDCLSMSFVVKNNTRNVVFDVGITLL